MATILMSILPKDSVLLWVLRTKGLNVNDILKETFLVYGKKYLSRKAVHNWVEKFSQGLSKVTDDAPLGAEVAETTVKILLCYEFRRTGKAMGPAYQCWWRICPEIDVFF
jgi:hypothetical protein